MVFLREIVAFATFYLFGQVFKAKYLKDASESQPAPFGCNAGGPVASNAVV
jgi:hypothetical protein